MLNQFSRTELLLGHEAMEKLAGCRVAVFGIGGVGGYTVEALARSGVGALDLIDDDRERFLHASPTTTAYQLYVASLAWFSEDYRTHFPEKVAAAEANETAPATTHALFHTMADMASIRGRFLTTKVSLVSPDFDRTAPRRYLNDHNEAVPFRKTGLRHEDMEVFRRYGIEL